MSWIPLVVLGIIIGIAFAEFINWYTTERKLLIMRGGDKKNTRFKS